MNKSSGRNQLILTIINVLIILAVAGLFVMRVVKFKAHFDELDKYNVYDYPLADVLVSQIDLLQQDRLYENEDGTYSFKGYVMNNYVSYNGLLYRIVEIGKEKEIVLVSNESVTLSTLSQRERLDSTPLYNWLNARNGEHTGIFEATLNNKEDFLTDCTNNFAALESAGDTSRHVTSTDGYVSLLSVNQYYAGGEAESYLNNGEPFWLSNVDHNGYSYYVAEDGDVKLAKDASLMLCVRPVITLKPGVKALKGSGSATDPYLLNENDPYQAKDIWTGAFISYDNALWRVTGRDVEGNLIVTGTNIAMREDGPVTIRQAHNNVYNTQTGAGYHFNHTYVKNMYRYEDFLTRIDWPIGGSQDSEFFDYRDNFQRTLRCYVFIPTTADMFLNDHQPCRLMTYDPFSQSTAYMIEEYKLKPFNTTKEGNYRICVCLKGSLMVADGFGTKEEPYVLEVDEG